MATGLHLYQKGTLPPLRSHCLPQSPHPQDVPGLESSSRAVSRKKHRDREAGLEGREKAVQQTLLEQILGLQNELTKCGILKNTRDYENFWELVQEEASGTEVKEKLQKIKLKLMNPRPQPPGAPRRQETGPLVSADQDTGRHQETQLTST